MPYLKEYLEILHDAVSGRLLRQGAPEFTPWGWVYGNFNKLYSEAVERAKVQVQEVDITASFHSAGNRLSEGTK